MAGWSRCGARDASGSYFDVLGVRPAIRRLLTPSDDRLAPPVAVLSYAYWQSRSGGSPDVLGKTVTINRTPFTIVGVAERRFTGLVPGRLSGITVPFTVQDASSLREATWFFEIVARLKPGVDPRQANAELQPIFRRYMDALADLSPAMLRDYLDHMELLPASRGMGTLRGRFGEPLMILMVVVAGGAAGGLLEPGEFVPGPRIEPAERVRGAAGDRRREMAAGSPGAHRDHAPLRLRRRRGTFVRGVGKPDAGRFSGGGAHAADYRARTGRRGSRVDPAGITVLTALLFGVAPTLAATRVNPARLASSDRATESPARARMRQISGWRRWRSRSRC